MGSIKWDPPYELLVMKTRRNAVNNEAISRVSLITNSVVFSIVEYSSSRTSQLSCLIVCFCFGTFCIFKKSAFGECECKIELIGATNAELVYFIRTVLCYNVCTFTLKDNTVSQRQCSTYRRHAHMHTCSHIAHAEVVTHKHTPNSW